MRMHRLHPALTNRGMQGQRPALPSSLGQRPRRRAVHVLCNVPGGEPSYTAAARFPVLRPLQGEIDQSGH
jgi:hypothetical protein